FAERRTTVVYATTEPQEALQLGGHTHVLDAGHLLQSGRTLDVFRRPATLAAARAFSDPPLNVLPATIDAAAGVARLADSSVLQLPQAHHAQLPAADRDVIFALRAHQLSLEPRDSGHCYLRGQ